jgi:hypothetical protein
VKRRKRGRHFYHIYPPPSPEVPPRWFDLFCCRPPVDNPCCHCRSRVIMSPSPFAPFTTDMLSFADNSTIIINAGDVYPSNGGDCNRHNCGDDLDDPPVFPPPKSGDKDFMENGGCCCTQCSNSCWDFDGASQETGDMSDDVMYECSVCSADGTAQCHPDAGGYPAPVPQDEVIYKAAYFHM